MASGPELRTTTSAGLGHLPQDLENQAAHAPAMHIGLRLEVQADVDAILTRLPPLHARGGAPPVIRHVQLEIDRLGVDLRLL
jgi:hypothetical protein